MTEFPTRFDYQNNELKIYQQWLESGGFSPDLSSDAESRCILMPPPNANGALHLGHAYEIAIQDTLTRYWRMQGFKTLWQPGTDHAGFETQIVYDKKLEKEGRSRFSIPREELFNEIYSFSLSSQAMMRQQFERLGASCDWTRFRFMLEPDLVNVVYKTFKSLYEDGLIYRAKRPVHWCIKHQTTLSDLEVNDEERTDSLYYIKYGPLTLATVRPETKFGDTAVAVHPDDERYKSYIGQELEIETVLGVAKIKVIADEYVKPEFGTGVVKITPAHDPNDFEVAQRHNLPMKVVIDQYGKLNEYAGPYAGMKIVEAREKIVADMEAKGLIEKIVPYPHTVKVCYKCNSLIEPRILDQWWLSLTKPSERLGKSLGQLAIDAIATKETTFVTEHYEKQFYNWMNNVRDWPLSRQIVWGIQLPVWYAADGSVVVTDGQEPENAAELTRDSDVFDTWFSSCQWPFSTLGTHGDDLNHFYPTTVMSPGYEIIFFWVSRMMMLSSYTQGKSPYKDIFLHGIVRDSKGKKMSKSQGNAIDPLTMSDLYGADAIRLAVLFGVAPETDPTVGEEKIRGMRNFTTKLWNIARFVSMSIDDTTKEEFIQVSDADSVVLNRLQEVTQKAKESIDSYNLHLAIEALYHFAWNDVADVYVEAAKSQLLDESTKATTQGNLKYVILKTIALLHPFAPFVTEAIWQQFASEQGCLMNNAWASTE